MSVNSVIDGLLVDTLCKVCYLQVISSYSLLFSCYRQDLPQAALPVFRLLTGRFGVFRPAGATRCTDQGQIWQGEWTVGPLLPAKFDLDRFRGGGLRPPKRKKNSNFTNIIAPKGRVP